MKKRIILVLATISLFALAQVANAEDYNLGPASVYIHINSTGHFTSSNMIQVDLSGYSVEERITSIDVVGYLGTGATWGIGYYQYDSTGNYIGTHYQSMGAQNPNVTVTPDVTAPQAFLYVDNAGADTYIYFAEFTGYNSQGNFVRGIFTAPSDYLPPSDGGTGSTGVSIITSPTGNVTINIPAPPPPPPPPPVTQPPANPATPSFNSQMPTFNQPTAYQLEESHPVNITVPTYTQPDPIPSPGPLPEAPSLESSLPEHDLPITQESATQRDNLLQVDGVLVKDSVGERDAWLLDSPIERDQPDSMDVIERDPVLNTDNPLYPDQLEVDPILKRDDPLTPDPILK